MSKMIYLSPLINYATTFQLQPKICQKPLTKIFDKNPTKTPQKFGRTKTFIYF